MKKMRLLTLVIICALLLGSMAFASESLSASIEGNILKVRWNASGEGVLTVYKNDWPITICNVNCADGGADIPLGEASGGYSVRLKTASSCLTASASAPEIAATPAVTEMPVLPPETEPVSAEVQTTAAPESSQTPEPTATPEITQTPEPTAVPTATPAVTPTPDVTAAPTMQVERTATVSSETFQNSLAAQVVEQVNAERAKYGLSALRTDSELTRAACVRAQEIVVEFSHTRPDGSQWSTVSSSAYGENIAKGQRTVDRVMASWMSSEGHRANILRESYGSIGVCAYVVDGITYWVQLFGK